MAIRTVVTRGFGNGTFNGTIPLVVTKGYAIAAAAAVFTEYVTLISDSMRSKLVGDVRRSLLVGEGNLSTLVSDSARSKLIADDRRTKTVGD